MMSDFFITLISNSSLDVFPENKTASFTVLLPEKITLRGAWCVALAEIHYNYNFFNVSDGHNKITFIESENSTTAQKVHKVYVTTGFYMSVHDIITTVNTMLRQHVCHKRDDEIFSLDKVNNRTLVHGGLVQKNVESVIFEGRLSMQLGFPPKTNVLKHTLSPHVGNIFFGVPDQMLIYTDIIQPTLVGHERASVLKIVNTESKYTTFGDACYKEYTHMHYLPVQKREFETISIDIRDYTGVHMPFQHGVLTIKLHFKQQNE